MGKLKERLPLTDASNGYIYEIESDNMPIRDHAGVMFVRETPSGSELVWRQYFNGRGFLKPILFRRLTPMMMTMAMNSLGKQFGGNQPSIRWIGG